MKKTLAKTQRREAISVMNERPIIFSGESVRAILEGRKTQERRLLQHPQRGVLLDGMCFGKGNPAIPLALPGLDPIVCPYGKRGDWLWVREMFTLQSSVDDERPPFTDGRPVRHPYAEVADADDCGFWVQPHYRASDPTPELCCERQNCRRADGPHCHWQPAFLMPRWASRITLEITGIRVQRVQEISEEECWAEGIQIPVERVQDPPVKGLMRITGPYAPVLYMPPAVILRILRAPWARAHYASLWDSLNCQRGYGWEKNPWVWALTFRRIESAKSADEKHSSGNNDLKDLKSWN